MIGKAIFLGGNAQSLNDVAGQPIAEYVHTKSGTVHNLTGPQNAKYINFKATGDYNDGDTWTLNNKPVTVTYNGGEELLPTAVLVGDVVQAVVMGNQVRLILQKPTPQENLLINWDFTNPVNQRTKEVYEGNKIVTIDMWKTYNQTTGHKVKIMDGYVRLEKDPDVPFASMIQYTEFPSKFAGKTICFFVLYRAPNPFQIFVGTDENGTMNVVKKIGNLPAATDWTLAGISFDVPETTKEQFTVFMQVNNKYGPSTYCDIKKVKIEQGNRFTGWPAWDYGAELLKCQRYQMEFVHPVTNIPTTSERYGVLGTGMATSDTRAFIFIPTLVQIRTSPVISFKGNIRLRTGSSSNAAIRGHLITDIVRSSNLSNNGLCIICQVSKDTPLNVGEMYELWSVPSTEGNSLLADANL